MKKERILSIMLVCLLALVSLGGISCTSFQISGVEVVQQPSSGDVCGNFDIEVKTTKLLGQSGGHTLFNITSDATDPKIINAIKSEIAKLGGSKAINVKIEYKATGIQLLLNYITWYIYSPATAHVTGTIIK
jgi:hypothetical protein